MHLFYANLYVLCVLWCLYYFEIDFQDNVVPDGFDGDVTEERASDTFDCNECLEETEAQENTNTEEQFVEDNNSSNVCTLNCIFIIICIKYEIVYNIYSTIASANPKHETLFDTVHLSC